MAVRNRLIEREKLRKLSLWLFYSHRSRLRNVQKSGCFGKLIGAKKGYTFQFDIFLLVILHILLTFRIIMSFRKPRHMPFRKLIPSFTLTVGQMRDKTFETDVLILTNFDSFLNDLSIKRHWLTLISLCPTCSKSAFFLESYTTNGERSGLRNTWHERKNLLIRPSVFERKLNNFFDGSHLKCGNQLKQN